MSWTSGSFDLIALTASSAESTASQAQTVSAAAEQISRSVDSVSAGSQEMGASIREISQNASEAAQVAGEAVGLARHVRPHSRPQRVVFGLVVDQQELLEELPPQGGSQQLARVGGRPARDACDLHELAAQGVVHREHHAHVELVIHVCSSVFLMGTSLL